MSRGIESVDVPNVSKSVDVLAVWFIIPRTKSPNVPNVHPRKQTESRQLPRNKIKVQQKKRAPSIVDEADFTLLWSPLKCPPRAAKGDLHLPITQVAEKGGPVPVETTRRFTVASKRTPNSGY